MLRGLIIIICLVQLACAAASTTPERKKRSTLHTKIGTSLLTNGKLPEALGELLKAIELDNDNAVAHNNIALIYLFRNRSDLSEQHLQRALRLQPNYTEAKNNLGRVYIETKNYPKAIALLEEASSDLTYTEPQKTYANLSLAYFESGDSKNALKSIEKSLNFDRNRCASLNLYGRILYRMKLYKPASASFDLAIDKCESQPFAEPHYFSGLSYMKSGNKELAKTRFEETVKLFPMSKYGRQAQVALEKIK